MLSKDGLRRRLVMLWLVAVVASLLSAAPGWGSESGSVWDLPAAPISDPSTWGQDPVWQQALAQTKSQDAAQQDQVEAAAVDGTDARSASEFADLSRSESQDLAQQTFPDLMIAPLDALGLPEGDHVTSYVSATQARIKDEHGKSLLLESSDPIAVPGDDGSGALSKVDLSLSSQDGAVVPNNPAVEVRLPDSATDALSLPDTGLGVSLADGADVTGQVEDDRVFYGEVSTDTDYITVAQPYGAQVMWQLRSAQATESPSLDLDLPAGQHARLTSMLTGASSDEENPSVQIVDDNNTVVDTIAAPQAFDADDNPVSARYRLEGGRLYVDVPHREQQVHYPVMVDPEVDEVWGYGSGYSDWVNDGAGSTNFADRRWAFNYNAGQAFYTWQTYDTQPDLGPGLFIKSMPGGYYAGATAFFSWGVPGNGYVKLVSAWFNGLLHRTEGDHLYVGIMAPGGAWESVQDFYGDVTEAQSSQIPQTPIDGSSALMGVWEDQTVNHPVDGWVGMRGVKLILRDDYAPTVTLNNYVVNSVSTALAPDGTAPWVRTDASVTVTVGSNDRGLGLRGVGVARNADPDNWIGTPWTSGCAGYRSSPCPLNVNWTNNTLPLPAMLGYTDLHTRAVDVNEHVGTGPTFRMRVDGDNPRITLSGNVADAAASGVPVSSSDQPSVNVLVTDGSAASNATYQSGVKHVITTLDGAVISDWTNQNGDGTNNDYGPTFQLNPRSDLVTHTLTVQAWDYLGHPGTKTLSFSYTPDGVVAGDAPLTTTDEATYGNDACVAAEGATSSYCAPASDDGSASSSASSLTATAATHQLIYGISDDDAAFTASSVQGSYLDSPLFQALKVKRVRRIVAWDLFNGTSPYQARRIAAFNTFYKKAVGAGKDIMVSFQLPCLADAAVGTAPQDTCYRDGDDDNDGVFNSGEERPPAQQTWINAIRRFKSRFPRVVSMSAWNEPNHRRQPTNVYNDLGGGPKRAALYTYVLERYVCAPFRRSGKGACTVIAGDVAESSSFSEIGYIKTYKASLDSRFAASGNPSDLQYPSHWATHPYTDVSSRPAYASSGLSKFVAAVGSDKRIWLTEAGAHVDGHTEADQEAGADYLVKTLAPNPQIDRVYYYSFCPGDSAFDTGLTKRVSGSAYCGDTARPAYTTYKTATLTNPNG